MKAWLGAAAAVSGVGTLVYMLARSGRRRDTGQSGTASGTHTVQKCTSEASYVSSNSQDTGLEKDGSYDRLNGHLPGLGVAKESVKQGVTDHGEQNTHDIPLPSNDNCVRELSSTVGENVSECVPVTETKTGGKEDPNPASSACNDTEVIPQLHSEETPHIVTVTEAVTDKTEDARSQYPQEQDGSETEQKKDTETQYSTSDNAMTLSTDLKTNERVTYGETQLTNSNADETISSVTDSTILAESLLESESSPRAEPVVEELSQCLILKPQCDPSCHEHQSDTCHASSSQVSTELPSDATKTAAEAPDTELSTQTLESKPPTLQQYTLFLKSEENDCISGKHIHELSLTEQPAEISEMNKEEPATCTEKTEVVECKQLSAVPSTEEGTCIAGDTEKQEQNINKEDGVTTNQECAAGNSETVTFHQKSDGKNMKEEVTKKPEENDSIQERNKEQKQITNEKVAAKEQEQSKEEEEEKSNEKQEPNKKEKESKEKQTQSNKEEESNKKQEENNKTEKTNKKQETERKEKENNDHQSTEKKEESVEKVDQSEALDENVKEIVTNNQIVNSSTDDGSSKKGSVRSRGDSASADLDCDLGSEQDNVNCDSSSLKSMDSGQGSSEIEPETLFAPSNFPVTNQEQYIFYDFEIPQMLVGRLIGRKGAFINKIKAATDATVIVHPHKNRKLKLCSVEGTKQQVNAALEMIRKHFPDSQYPDISLQQVSSQPQTQPQMQPQVNAQSMQIELTAGVVVEVRVSAVVSGGELWVQQPLHPSYSALHRLQTCMNLNYGDGSNTPPLPGPICDGTVCVARINEHWMRCQVLSSLNTMSVVLLLDIGGTVTVPSCSLRQIRYDYMTLPFQAMQCFLHGVQPVTGNMWSKAATTVMEELVSGVILFAVVVSYTEDCVPLVNLYRRDQDQFVLLNEKLVQLGHAQWISPQASS